AIFFATFLYLIVFVGDFSFARITVDEGPPGPVAAAAAIDIALIALFGIQHSVMARQGFKKWWTRVIPKPAERSVYVLMASAVLIVLMTLWRPIPSAIWDIANPLAANAIWGLFWIGWGMVLLSTFLINHFELFGLQQAWLNMQGREAEPPKFHQPLLYKWVRHPLYLGFFLAFWAAPEMTAGHLLLAVGVSIYMLIAIRYEERDLVDMFGQDYENYRRDVGMLTPRFRRRST
ncbi:MAG TPA: isoprenylcysteine carboxylmethyltransferase family protein, partial [Sphingomicrobium sp.]|nr:isoprenylcysteine carboxylmethyltransferase family protein [Sphingomicrobium sp.]